MKNRFRMDDRGSITILLMLLLPLWLLLAGVLLDRATFFHSYRAFIRENELRLAAEFRHFDRTLFDRFGLLALLARQSDIQYGNPLGNIQSLEKSIISLMRHRALNDLTILGAQAVSSNQILEDILSIRDDVDEVIALKDAINRSIARGEVPGLNDLGRLAAKVSCNPAFFDYPYGDIKEILSLPSEAYIELEVSRLIKEIQWQYFDCFSEMALDPISEKYLIAAYCIDYLGYSCNLSKKEIFTSEYVLTGLELTAHQMPAVRSELVMVRTLLNAASLAADSKRRATYLVKSGGDVRVQLLYLLLDAIKLGIQDMEYLVDGGQVPLFKNAAQLDQRTFKTGMVYKDYMEMMLMVTPRRLLLERIHDAICSGGRYSLDHYYTTLEISDRFIYRFRFFGGEYEKTKDFSIDF